MTKHHKTSHNLQIATASDVEACSSLILFQVVLVFCGDGSNCFNKVGTFCQHKLGL